MLRYRRMKLKIKSRDDDGFDTTSSSIIPYKRIQASQIKKDQIGKTNAVLEVIDDRKKLSNNYEVVINKIKVWVGKENEEDEDNICGVQFFYQHKNGKIYEGKKMVKKKEQYTI